MPCFAESIFLELNVDPFPESSTIAKELGHERISFSGMLVVHCSLHVRKVAYFALFFNEKRKLLNGMSFLVCLGTISAEAIFSWLKSVDVPKGEWWSETIDQLIPCEPLVRLGYHSLVLDTKLYCLNAQDVTMISERELMDAVSRGMRQLA